MTSYVISRNMVVRDTAKLEMGVLWKVLRDDLVPVFSWHLLVVRKTR